MSTGLDIITDALQELGIVGAGQSVSAEDAALCLRRLNQVVQRWSNMRLFFPVLTEISITLDGSASYLVGPGGATVTARPNRIMSATAIDSGGLEYPVDIISRREWDSIVQKDVTGGPPEYIWHEALSTNSAVHVYPKASSYTLKLDCQVLLSSFTFAGDVTLPEGYESALVLTLAYDVAGAFGVPVRPDLMRKQSAAVRAIKRTNAEPVILTSERATDEPAEIERGY